MLEQIINYFESDPLRILYLLGGTGGIWYWIKEWLNRTRIKIRFIQEHYDPIEQPLTKVDLRIEVTNIGNSMTSLKPNISVVGYTPKRKKEKYILSLDDDTERSLPSHQPKNFKASAKVGAVFPFLWFKKYTFKLTKGYNSNLRILNASGREIGAFDRIWGIFLYKIFNKIKNKE